LGNRRIKIPNIKADKGLKEVKEIFIVFYKPNKRARKMMTATTNIKWIKLPPRRREKPPSQEISKMTSKMSSNFIILLN